MGVVQYSDAPRLEILLGKHQGEEELIGAIQSISYLGGNTQARRRSDLYTVSEMPIQVAVF